MITNFYTLLLKLKSNGYDFDSLNLTEKEISLLKNEIDSFTERSLEKVHRILADHYGLKVPSELVKTVLKSDLDLASEVFGNSVGDTCQRSILINSILSHIGCPNWPSYGDSQEYTDNFIKLLKEKAPKFNIQEIEY